MKATYYKLASLDKVTEEKREDLPSVVFHDDYRKQWILDLVRIELSNRRQGSHKVKIRDEVRGGGRKPWRQKGTGNARQGSIRAPQWRGGGVVHGPQVRRYSLTMPRKLRLQAVGALLSYKAQTVEVKVLESFPVDKIKKSKDMHLLLANMGIPMKKSQIGIRVLFISADEQKDIKKSIKNLQGVTFMHSNRLNAPEIYSSQCLIFTVSALKSLEKFKKLKAKEKK